MSKIHALFTNPQRSQLSTVCWQKSNVTSRHSVFHYLIFLASSCAQLFRHNSSHPIGACVQPFPPASALCSLPLSWINERICVLLFFLFRSVPIRTSRDFPGSKNGFKSHLYTLWFARINDCREFKHSWHYRDWAVLPSRMDNIGYRTGHTVCVTAAVAVHDLHIIINRKCIPSGTIIHLLANPRTKIRGTVRNCQSRELDCFIDRNFRTGMWFGRRQRACFMKGTFSRGQFSTDFKCFKI